MLNYIPLFKRGTSEVSIMEYIRFFDTLKLSDIAEVGGKNASLGEMVCSLGGAGVKVPLGFATTASAYHLLLDENRLRGPIAELLNALDISDVQDLQKRGKAVRQLFLDATLPQILQDQIITAYTELCERYETPDLSVAVRSSGTAEDLPDASFAGQQETFLHIRGKEALLDSVRRCFASLFTDRAISYRHSRGFDHFKVALSVGVQKMVGSDEASSGIMFTIDTESGSPDLIMINATWGLGENIVGGNINPDEFYLFKPTLKKGFSTIVKRTLGSKKLTMIYTGDSDRPTKNIDTPIARQQQFCLTDAEILQLGQAALKIEEHYSQIAGSYRPMDIEWAKEAETGELYIVQARPETVRSKELEGGVKHHLHTYHLTADKNEKKLLLTGRAVGDKIGTGRVHVIEDLAHAPDFKEGEVLVADNTDPDWEPIMKKASAVVTNRGGRTCHAAIVAREIGVPAIVGTSDATNTLFNGQDVTISCAEGEDGFIYEGILPFEQKDIDLSHLPQTKTKLYMNVGNPDHAFRFAQLPNDGVGLARMEFIVNSAIKAHPMALYYLHKGESIRDQQKVEALISGYDDPKSFFIEQLATGIGMIAAAFYPRPVIVRTSDFKSNEYKNMLGGNAFERDEENPMIGFRGASRYYSKEYRHAFEWECEALKHVRDTMGLDNVKIMIPFVRTPQEGQNVIDIMKENGLVQGQNGLEVYAMCEIPSNVILADRFLEIFDGYSIGSNDLTQLTLGVDRDSELISHIFDERNEAVTRMLEMAIKAAKKAGKYIGICGQAPSDYPEITRFLVQNGIDSISLNPDSVMKMRQVVVELESQKH